MSVSDHHDRNRDDETGFDLRLSFSDVACLPDGPDRGQSQEPVTARPGPVTPLAGALAMNRETNPSA